MNTETVERAVNALLKARNDVQDMIDNPSQGEPRFPWRNYPQDSEVDPSFLRNVLNDLDSQIIGMERETYRDPVQDAEMRAELYAEMALTGVADDPSLYMHTPHEERLFQDRIAHEARYGYYDPEDGWVDGTDGYAPQDYNCPTCKTPGTYFDGDEIYMVDGSDACHVCIEEVVAFMELLAFLTGTQLVDDRGIEFWFATERNR